MPADAHPPLFRQRSFAALWTGQLVSIVGDRLTYLALVGLLSEHTHHFVDPGASLLLSVLANVMLAPVLVFAPFTGAWVDRSNLKRVLITSDVLRAAIVWGVPAVYLLTHNTFPVFVLVFLLFTCNVFFLPARSAITPEIVPADQLLAANAFLSIAGVIATAAGALAGGWVVDHWGWPIAMRIDAVTYLVSVVTLSMVRYRASARKPSARREGPSWRRYLAEVGEGFEVVRRNSVVGLALTALGAVWIGGGFLHVAGNLHIQRVASVPGMERLGILLCVLGLGAAIGTWYVNTRGRRWPRPLLLGGGLVLVGIALVAFAVTRRFAVFSISAFLVGLFAAPAFVLTETLLQEGTELKQRGRVFSLRDFVMRLLFMVSVAVAGSLTRAFDTTPTLLVCAACLVAAGLLTIGWGKRDPSLMRVAEV